MGITTSSSFQNFRSTVLSAVVDALIFMILPCADLFQLKNEYTDAETGKIMGLDAHLIINGIILTLFQFWR